MKPTAATYLINIINWPKKMKIFARDRCWSPMADLWAQCFWQLHDVQCSEMIHSWYDHCLIMIMIELTFIYIYSIVSLNMCGSANLPVPLLHVSYLHTPTPQVDLATRPLPHQLWAIQHRGQAFCLLCVKVRHPSGPCGGNESVTHVLRMTYTCVLDQSFQIWPSHVGSSKAKIISMSETNACRATQWLPLKHYGKT